MKTIFLTALFSYFFITSFAQRLSATEFLINCTIKIECEKETNGKKYLSFGTGFFFQYIIDNKYTSTVIVTNKHVIKGAITGFLYFKDWDSTNYPIYGKNRRLKIENFEKGWLTHPDTSVDLAIFSMDMLQQKVLEKGEKRLQCTVLSEENLINDSILSNINAIEDVYMIGYPYGLRDEINDLPIVRKGITATPLFLDYQSKKEFLIDMPVYKGSSGSPILIYNNVYTPKGRTPLLKERLLLAGINFATYYKDFDGKFIRKSTDTIEDSLKIITALPLYNIGVIIKSERLLDFKKIFQNMKKEYIKKE